MAANTNMFTDKETTNWFKACIALNVTKEGLTNFIDTELQKVHSAVGTSCGKCCIEKLLPCPTHKYCQKKKGNYCSFHNSQKPQQCQTCDNVKQNIVTQHRYGGPSWRNTHAERWAQNNWEIGKCFLPPDGYSSVSSVQESDFNGAISIMLNCLHFQTCLSSTCLSPPPPDEQCPLEKVRQIGRDVRHTSDCKVTDADLQDYFQTLSTLLADPNCLQHDPSATLACTRLSDLQNDRMSIKELGELLKEAYQTLEHAIKAGERFSQEAERTLAKALDAIRLGEQRLEKKAQVGEQRIKSQIYHGQHRLKSKIKVGEQLLDRKTRTGEERIKSKTQIEEERIEKKTKRGELRIGRKIHDAEQCLEDKIQVGEQRIEYNVQDGIMRMQQAANGTSQADYERVVADLRRRLMEHYNDNSSNVPLSILDQSLDKRITDIYETPKMHRYEIAKDGQRIKKEQVLTYKELFYTKDTKSNRRIYVQGEPGSGKSTFAAKIIHDWSYRNQHSSAATSENSMFNDVLSITHFTFIFFISLRDARGQTGVVQMIQKQIIDSIYSEDNRAFVYKLLHQIIETELCLVVRDGLDEWLAPDGGNLAEPSMAGFPSDKCTVLTTSRPWKLADERIKNSQIDILLEIEGLNNPYKFTKRIMRCILDESKDLKTISREFENFIGKHELSSLSYSPMLYTLVICTWVDKMGVEENLKRSSLCALYTTLLESLCKKANDTPGFFNDLNPSQVKCFSSTRYLRSIIQNVEVISKPAFHLLLSTEKESSIVFNDHKLSNYVSKSEGEFALKAGLISKRKTKNTSNSSISFIHKSMQEFLAAFHIACNSNSIDDALSEYLNRHQDAFVEMSQVFIFLCGLNISAANKLSCMMNKCNNRMIDEYSPPSVPFATFQGIIVAGYREAVSSEQTGISLRLSHFQVNTYNFRDLYNIWMDNTSNVQILQVFEDSDHYSRRSPAHSEPTSHVEFNLSSCHKLKSLNLMGRGILLKDSSSLVSPALSKFWIVLNCVDPAHCADSPPALPCIEHVELRFVTCSSTWLRSLFSTLLTLDHEVICNLDNCIITSCVDESDKRSDTNIQATITTGINNTLNMRNVYDSVGLWKALHGLNIKSLSLRNEFRCFEVRHVTSLSQGLSSLTHLETLSVQLEYDITGLCKALYGLNIKSLSICFTFSSGLVWLDVSNAQLLSQSLLSLKQLETLSIYVETYINIQLPKSLKYLNIYCRTLFPSNVFELRDTLSCFSHIVWIKLEFGCPSFDGFFLNAVPLEEYIAIKQKLETSKKVTVKGFRILDRTCNKDIDAASAWSVRDIVGDNDDNQDDDYVTDGAYKGFVSGMSNAITNRISMRLLINPAS